MPGLYCFSECRGFGPARTCIFKCVYLALEGKSRPHDADAENQIAAKARAATRLYDSFRGGAFLMVRPPGASSGSLLLDWLVHRVEERRDNGPEVVDGES